MAINYYKDKVQVSHKLNKDECDEINNFLQKNPDKPLRLYWFEDVSELDFVANITNLKKLEINYSSLENIDFISSITDLEYLDISEMQGNLNVEAIKHLEKLKVLNLALNKATRQTDLSILSNIKQLEEFYFSGKFKKNSLDINVLKNIKVLAPQLNTINFKELEVLEHLKELRIFNQKASTLEGIEKFTSIEKILINGLRMENQNKLSPIFKLPNLKILNLFYIKFIEDFSFIKAEHNLETLILWTLNGLKSYSGIEKLHQLKKLSHCGGHNEPNDIDFEDILKLKNLREIEIKIGKVNNETKNIIEKIIAHRAF